MGFRGRLRYRPRAMGPQNQPHLPQEPNVLPPSIRRVPRDKHDAAKWPPDDSALPPGPPAPAGPYIPGGDDGNFKRGRFAPIAIIIGILAVGAVAGILVFGSMKDAEKMDPKKVALEKKEIALLPIDEALPKYRAWGSQEAETKLQEEGFTQLAWAKDPLGIPIITKGLSSIDHGVRGTAAQALLEYGTPAADSAKPALLKALKESTEADRPQIAWALATLHEPSAFDDVMKEYRAGRLATVQRLDKSPAFDPDHLAAMVSLDKLATLSTDPSESVRQLVATCLARMGDAKYTTILIQLVKDKSTEVAREAAVGLGKIANDQSMNPLLEALNKADKDSRQKFLEALRDGVGARGLVLALKSVQKDKASTEKFQTKLIFDMLRSIEDPRGGDLLAQYIATNPQPHWKTEAALRLAETGDMRAVPTLAWRMKQSPLTLYNKDTDEELRRDDNERVVSARMLADLAILHPDKKEEIRAAAFDGVKFWITDMPQPHANGMRFMAASEAKEALPLLKKWAEPGTKFPQAGQQQFPPEWGTAQSALRYLGWMKEPSAWPILEKQFSARPKDIDGTQESLEQGGLAVLGMTLRAIGAGASDGFAQWGDPKAYPVLVKFIEEKMNHAEARLYACAALSWVATDQQMAEVAKKVVKDFATDEPKIQIIRTCYLETLIHRPVAAATGSLVELINGTSDLVVQHQAARAIGAGGMTPQITLQLMEKLKNPGTRDDAALAILMGGDTDSIRRMLAHYNDSDAQAMENLKSIYNQTFGYWSDKNYENGDVARWINNAHSSAHVRVKDALQDWPRLVLSRAIQGIDFDNGPHSVTRVQFRVRLMRDAKSQDEKKRTDAVQILKFMGEKGVLMMLKGEPGPWQEPARQAFFELMNPKATAESIPEGRKSSGGTAGANVIAPK